MEVANALGHRDRCLGIDAEGRGVTLDRFKGRPRVARAYWRGYYEADHYVDNHYRWGAENAMRTCFVAKLAMQHACNTSRKAYC